MPAINKRRRVAQAVMLMTAIVLTSEPSTKRRRTEKVERIEDTYTHSFEEMYVADALLCIGRGTWILKKTLEKKNSS